MQNSALLPPACVCLGQGTSSHQSACSKSQPTLTSQSGRIWDGERGTAVDEESCQPFRDHYLSSSTALNISKRSYWNPPRIIDLFNSEKASAPAGLVSFFELVQPQELGESYSCICAS
ncbi:hypothetical protein NP493_873g01020 [Ridgeia piscesae]|uniref:Uncharacterized protein n=1 Tax=Ridgeia piscesae TaxID=27915 RepID=A0AAD9KLN0_RIDPI|nr:hypothetical protein NP493_873g01020 [Ridgeia piscesae]